MGLIIGAIATIMIALNTEPVQTQDDLCREKDCDKDPGASGLAPGLEAERPGDAQESAPGHGDKVFDFPGLEGLDSGGESSGSFSQKRTTVYFDFK